MGLGGAAVQDNQRKPTHTRKPTCAGHKVGRHFVGRLRAEAAPESQHGAQRRPLRVPLAPRGAAALRGHGGRRLRRARRRLGCGGRRLGRGEEVLVGAGVVNARVELHAALSRGLKQARGED
jgi:hypothetical protein